MDRAIRDASEFSAIFKPGDTFWVVVPDYNVPCTVAGPPLFAEGPYEVLDICPELPGSPTLVAHVPGATFQVEYIVGAGCGVFRTKEDALASFTDRKPVFANDEALEDALKAESFSEAHRIRMRYSHSIGGDGCRDYQSPYGRSMCLDDRDD